MTNPKPSMHGHEVPVEYIRTLDGKLLPPRVGHNWFDAAFRKRQEKQQQLEAEFRGKRAFLSKGTYDHTPPEGLGLTAQQLLHALSTRRADTKEGTNQAAYMTLADKVLRFYAFFTERAPEGCQEDYWHRRVVIHFYPEDDTILIQEPQIPNSGLLGGLYLKRQPVRADPRQREEFPDDEFLTINHFNVGRSVRINAVEFFLYDCDQFTRDFLTALGVPVVDALPCPDDAFMSRWKRTQERLVSGRFGILSQSYTGEEAVRAARFVQDSGKVLRFYGLLDERGAVAGGLVRKLEVMYFVEDDSIAIVERPTTNEAIPSLFLSRTWLPRDGSIAKANQLTFAHRVSGMREPFIGPNAYYTAADFNVGVTINVLGRRVLLYECDPYTRAYYRDNFGVDLRNAIDCTTNFGIAPESHVQPLPPTAIPATGTAMLTPGGAQESSTASTTLHSAKCSVPSRRREPRPKETLRFLLRMAAPCPPVERQRRFTLTYYTETEEAMLYETPIRNSGFVGGCFCRRQRILKPPTAESTKKAAAAATTTRTAKSKVESEHYTTADITVGGTIVVNGHRFDVVDMDEHTASFLEGRILQQMTEEQIRCLVAAFRLFLGTRYHACRDAFLAFDRDKDGVISVLEFVGYLQELQIAPRRIDAQALFDHISPNPDSAYLTMEDFVRWVDETGESHKQDPVKRGAIDVDKRALGKKALKQLCERLEARCINSVQMFRLASTMPRAYADPRVDIHSLTNPNRDALITPVQLRRCVEEVLGGTPAPEEMDCLLEFFFPRLPQSEYRAMRDTNLQHGIDLTEFQRKHHAMNQLQMLPEIQKRP